MVFVFMFVYVAPCIPVFAEGGTDTWQPNDEDKNGIIDEHDILIYCAKNGYILNEQQFKEASNNLEWVKSAQASSMITEIPTNLLSLSLYLVQGNNLDDMSQSALQDVVINFSSVVSQKSNKSINELNSMTQAELTSIVSDVVIGYLKDNSATNPFSNLMDCLLGYVIAPTFKPSELNEWYFSNDMAHGAIYDHYNNIGSCVGYIRALRWFDMYYPFRTVDFLKTDFVVNRNVVSDYDLNDWNSCVFKLKRQFSYMNFPPVHGEHTANTYQPVFISTYFNNVIYEFIPYQSEVYRIDEENGAFSPYNADASSYYFSLGAGTNADSTRCLDVFITTDKNSGIPIFKSVAELHRFTDGELYAYNCPTLLDIDWSNFPLADIDFTKLSNDIITAIIENKGLSAAELTQIIEDTILEHIENIDENTAEIVRLLKSGLFNDNDIPYLRLILEKLNSLNFNIDSGDINLQIDLTDVLQKLSNIENSLDDEASDVETIKTTVSNILQAQLSCNSTVTNIYEYLDELDLMLDLIESRLVAIDNKLNSTNSKLDTIIGLLGAKNLFPPSANPVDIADKIMELIETFLPLTQQEVVKTKFPFSLPFTLGFLLNMFDADAVEPSFHFEFSVMNKDIVFDFEFPSVVDDLIDVFQVFCKIGFCFFMIKLSKDVFEMYNDYID